MAETLVFACTIENLTATPLKVKSVNLEWGKWEDRGNHKPVEIPAGKRLQAFRTSGRQSSSSGTEGTVVYQFGDDSDATVEIYWDVPWAPGANNTLKVNTSSKYIVVQTDGFVGSGSTETVTMNVGRIK
ncbi:aegerolysin family protein [Kitasatospora sp. NPDC094016]|uniref:aegerolysin family protein n=1 Tax=Kitasatospora sp. NPDC094016 TaxID=3154986 RepID=UPI00331E0A53